MSHDLIQYMKMGYMVQFCIVKNKKSFSTRYGTATRFGSEGLFFFTLSFSSSKLSSSLLLELFNFGSLTENFYMVSVWVFVTEDVSVDHV